MINDLIAEMQSARVPLTLEFEAFSQEVHLGQIAPSSGPGPKKKTRIMRDLSITLTAGAVCDQFPTLKKSRKAGRPAIRRTICAIVADALRMVTHGDIDLGEDAVRKICEAHAWAIPTVDGWSRAWLDDC
jgi:hypothetical protein